MLVRAFLIGLFLLLPSAAVRAAAQVPTPPPPPPPLTQPPSARAGDPPGWTGSFGAGLALTQGNSDTNTINLAVDLMRDVGSPLIFRGTMLFIRGESAGALTANRLAVESRTDRRFTDRTSTFMRLQYLRDEFKEIDYLVSPTFGLAHLLVRNDRTQLQVDTGVGSVWEKNPDAPVEGSGAVTAGQNFKHKLSNSAEINERASALWRMEDFGNALYILSLGLAANVTAQTQVKVEGLNTFKNRPEEGVQKNDLAVLVSFVYKY